jgi:hypothetical protein
MNTKEPTNLFEEEISARIPSTLNVLTILSFIGCVISYLGIVMSLLSMSEYDSQVAQMQELKENNSDNGLVVSLINSSINVMQKTYEYRYLLMMSALVCTTFCLVGALQMRKLRFSGYVLYIIGEFTPVLISILLFGTTFFTGLPLLFSAAVALGFILFYSSQRKYLQNA